MAFDGITVSCLRKELSDKLTGGRITKIVQSEADELLLTIKNNANQYRLLLSASASLPLASVPVKISGHSYLDGGCACPIPINWALRQRFDKIVVVATREKGFRKKQPSQRMVNLYDDFYGDKPLFLATLLTQEMRYNALMDQLDELEADGRICMIRPDEPIGIGRFEGDTEKLTELYLRGYKEMQKKLDGMMQYLEK